MQIGRARPLACFCWLLCIVSAIYICLAPDSTDLWIGVILVSLFSLVLVVLACMLDSQKHRFLYLLFLSLALLVGLFSALLYEYRTVAPSRDFANDQQESAITVTGLVLSEQYYSNYLTCVEAEVDIPVVAKGQKATATMYLNLSGECDLQTGDRFTAKMTIYTVSDAPEDASVRRRLKSQGYTLVGYVQTPEDYTTLERGNFVLSQWLSSLQFRLSDRLSREVGGEEGRMVSALLLGTKSELSDAVKLDFRRSGASHLLALSGLHLSILLVILSGALKFLRCPFRLRTLLLSVIALAFLVLTGFSVSLLRATVMLLFLHWARLRGCPYDPLTSLSLFMGVTLTINPVAVFDAGLWLSVISTFVLVEVIPTLLRRGKKKSGVSSWPVIGPIVRYVLLPAAISAVILFFLLLPMTLIFGEVSLLSPISNLLLTPLTSIVLALGLCYFPLTYLGTVIPFFDFLSEHITAMLHTVASWMLRLTQYLSDMRGTVISLRYSFVAVLLAVLVVLLVLFLLLRWKQPRRFFGVMVGWTALFAVCLVITQWLSAGKWQASYLSNKDNELLCFYGNEGTVLCDVTDGSYTVYREFLSDHIPDSTTEIEVLVLTHYHNRHISTVYKLFGDIRVRTIWLPLTMPDTDQDKALKDESNLRAIAALAKERRVEVRYYLPEEGADVTPSLSLDRLYFSMLKRSTHPTVSMSWQYEKGDGEVGSLVWLGASSWESDLSAEIFHSIASADVLWFAAHGPMIKSTYSLTEWTNIPNLVLFANGEVSAAIEPSPDMSVVLRHARLLLGDEPIEMTLP